MTEKLITEDVWQTLCEGWASATAEGYAKNACILGTRVTIEVLKYFGINARPLPCELVVSNDRWTLAVTPDIPDDDPRKTTKGGYDAHLVAVTDDHHLLDLTLEQADRPQYGIVLCPVNVIVPDEFVDGGYWAGGQLNGCEVTYRARPDLGKEYTASADWQTNHKRLVGPIIRFMKGRMQ